MKQTRPAERRRPDRRVLRRRGRTLRSNRWPDRDHRGLDRHPGNERHRLGRGRGADAVGLGQERAERDDRRWVTHERVGAISVDGETVRRPARGVGGPPWQEAERAPTDLDDPVLHLVV